jgi:hypothetical protein
MAMKVVAPIAAATEVMFTLTNDRPTPTAMASMLVAKPVTASDMNEWRASDRPAWCPCAGLDNHLRTQDAEQCEGDPVAHALLAP